MVRVKNPIPPTHQPTRQLTRGLTHHWHTTDLSADTRMHQSTHRQGFGQHTTDVRQSPHHYHCQLTRWWDQIFYLNLSITLYGQHKEENKSATVITHAYWKFTLCTCQCVPPWLAHTTGLPVVQEWQFAQRFWPKLTDISMSKKRIPKWPLS